jgi:hypothetical protein
MDESEGVVVQIEGTATKDESTEAKLTMLPAAQQVAREMLEHMGESDDVSQSAGTEHRSVSDGGC